MRIAGHFAATCLPYLWQKPKVLPRGPERLHVEQANARKRPLARALEQRPRAVSGGPVDPEDRIVAAVRCANCGESIQGQYIGDGCYKCGHPNTDSVYGDLLIYSDDKSAVHRLHEAAAVVIYSAAILGALGLFIMLIPTLAAKGAIDVIDRAFEGLKFAVLIFPVVAFVGMALLTGNRSVSYFVQKYGNIPFLIRAVIYLGIGIFAIAALSRVAQVGSTLRLTTFLAWTMIPTIMFFRGLSGLLKRVPNLPLAAWCGFIIAGVMVLGAGGGFVHYAAPLAAGNSEWEGPVVAVKTLTVLGCLGWSIGAFALLRATRRTLEVVGL